MNLPVITTITHIINYLDKQGIVVDYNELHNHILETVGENNQKKTCKPKIKFKPKPKPTNNNTKKIKFKPKRKSSDFNRFVEICNKQNLYYFQYNDENNWKGPSIKIDLDNFDLTIFGDLELHLLEGFGFCILRPKTFECDKKIVYNELNYEQCKLIEEDIISLNGSDDESQNDCYDANTDYDDEDILTEDWTFTPNNTIYQLDTKTNNIYCNKTNQYVGKKIDDFNIDYDSKEHETISVNAEN